MFSSLFPVAPAVFFPKLRRPLVAEKALQIGERDAFFCQGICALTGDLLVGADLYEGSRVHAVGKPCAADGGQNVVRARNIVPEGYGGIGADEEGAEIIQLLRRFRCFLSLPEEFGAICR